MRKVLRNCCRCAGLAVFVLALCFEGGFAVACIATPTPTKTQGVSVPNKPADKANSRGSNRPALSGKKLLDERRDADPGGSPLSEFKDPKGKTILTTHPEKYRGQAGYAEISIQSNPITISPQDRKRAGKADHSELNIAGLAQRMSSQYGVDERLIEAMIHVLSKGNPAASSAKGTMGLMMLMPATAKEFGVQNIYDPAQNVSAGTQYMARLLKEFKDNQSVALEAYLEGPDAVRKRGKNPPSEEADTFVRRVMHEMNTEPVVSVEAPVAVASTEKSKAAELPVKISLGATPKYTVRFKSGTMQTADSVVLDGDYYYIAYHGFNFRTKKALVDSVTPAPVVRGTETAEIGLAR